MYVHVCMSVHAAYGSFSADTPFVVGDAVNQKIITKVLSRYFATVAESFVAKFHYSSGTRERERECVYVRVCAWVSVCVCGSVCVSV